MRRYAMLGDEKSYLIKSVINQGHVYKDYLNERLMYNLNICTLEKDM